MLPLARWRFLSFGLAAAWVAASAGAATLGSGPGSVTLGQPLSYVVPVQLDQGEVLSPECASAEVTLGDRRLAAGAVRAVVITAPTGATSVRVSSNVTVDEPMLSIDVTVGCNARFTRRFVVLADPPAAITAAEALPAAASAPASSAPPSQAAAPAAAASAPIAQTTSSAATAPAATAPARRPPLRRASAGSGSGARAQAAAAPSPSTARRPERPAQGLERPQAATHRGRLRLEAAEPPARASSTALALQDALRAAELAASAAQAAAAAASAQAAKVASLEATVEQMRGEAKAGRDQVAQMRARLSQAEASSGWVVPLMVIAGLMAALAAWLAWRVGRLQAAQRESWQAGLAAASTKAAGATAATSVGDDPNATDLLPNRHATAPAPFVTAARASAAAPAPAISRVKSGAAWPPPAPPVAWPPPDSTVPPDLAEVDTLPPVQRTEVLPPNALPNSAQTRDVSIEELIDLEQQAEFFAVLGQDEAAIDLLVDHLRSTGGGSPLPYLKLLEIHHRLNDRDAYERMRSRFNHRFNAYAPEWGVDLTSGRSVDDYPGVIPRVQQVWSRPLDAMAELEALLFRKNRGELFDLPAYREVLFLYQVARDLLDRQAADSGNVDLLLPMADGSEFGSTSPAPFLGLEHDAFKETQPPDDLPTAPVDFDVSSGDRPTSIFDLLDDGKRRSTRRP